MMPRDGTDQRRSRFNLNDCSVRTINSDVQRQSVLGKPVQDAQVPARVPAAVCVLRPRPDVLPRVLPLVQPGASPLGPRVADSSDRSLGSLGRSLGGAPENVVGSLCRHARTFCAARTSSTAITRCGLDQPSSRSRQIPGGSTPRATLNSKGQCLKVVDTFRSGTSSAHRQGFKKLLAEIGAGQVGVVLALEASRLARSSADWHRLVEICVVTCRHSWQMRPPCRRDPRDPNDRLLLGVKGTISEAELFTRRTRPARRTLEQGESAVVNWSARCRSGTSASRREQS